MNSTRCAARVAAALRQLPPARLPTRLCSRSFSASTSRAYNAYSLPSNAASKATAPPRTETVEETPLPRVHETRPPVNERSPPEAPAETAPKAAAPKTPEPQNQSQTAAASTSTSSAPARPRSRLRTPRKAAMKLTPAAVERLSSLLDSPDPKLIRVGVKNRGCSGLAYHLEYVDGPGKFDETVEQDGVKVLIDSKALFSIIGSEMDWAEDKLNQRFVFKNPNIKEECGCGESFMVG